MNKYRSSIHAQSEEQKVVERLQLLLMRVGTVIQEAGTRYLTNYGMMMQLKILSEDMYRGHICSIPQGTESSKTVQASTRLALQNWHTDVQISVSRASVIALTSLKK
uniref:Uncharacterized protein n=1 Tax=Aegilops tauschii subsp. strangulata TaxID=200361 RepID=A0A453A8R6_AEGTS